MTLRNLGRNLEQPVKAQPPQDRDRIWNVLEDLLVTIDAEGKYISVNPAWTTVLGWFEAELLGHNPEWLIHPDDRKKTVNELNRLAADQRTLRFENRLLHKNGTHRLFSWVAVRDQDLTYAAARDITEIKRSEDALRFSIREIGQADRHTTMSEMTASIAHEINQPLSAIITNSQAGLRWLARADPDLDEVRKVLNRIADDGRRAGEVISSIRAIFGEGRREKHSVKVNDLICDVLTIVQAELERQHVALRIELSDGVSEIVADRVQLQQVLLNLINNALEAMSSVTGRPRLLSVKSQILEPSDISILVEDCGPGIDPKNMDRIFDAFFTTKARGMGMGLSICRSIIEAHGRSPLGISRNDAWNHFLHHIADSWLRRPWPSCGNTALD
jgi:PAS domain S-box-containing protein